ncbi:MAG: hypothetical protein MJ189_02375 [Coriobacteriales bacterium]|nr:hypothetical protein [Coriobacteriales bacterium]
MSRFKKITSIFCASILVFALMASFSTALAVEDDSLQNVETDIEKSAKAYADALVKQAALDDEVANIKIRILELEDALPQQQERCNYSIKELYKFTPNRINMIMSLFSANNISDLITMVDSYNYIIGQNYEAVYKTATLKKELESSYSDLKIAKSDADGAASAAKANLEEAISLRQKNQEAALVQQKEEAKTTGVSSSAAAATKENVDWSENKKTFVNSWASRIDAYLSGSPTAGCGEYYAAAAWDYGVDPRWAPAISLSESGKGVKCFHPYNAWGYGQKEFSSWKEGIYTVVKTLGTPLYGGTLTMKSAKIYSGHEDPTDWYNLISGEMAKI